MASHNNQLPAAGSPGHETRTDATGVFAAPTAWLAAATGPSLQSSRPFGLLTVARGYLATIKASTADEWSFCRGE